ncbi:unnamed protein product [Amoebophrya sp. A25]|nr:unnamed protein product [Amoebophrya sp. A25]|eukprot:GSA25T00025313001.1
MTESSKKRAERSGSGEPASASPEQSVDGQQRRRRPPAQLEIATAETGSDAVNKAKRIPEDSPKAEKKKERRPPSPTKRALPPPASGASKIQLEVWSECVPLLRNEAFFVENAKYLIDHCFLRDMQNGKLSTNRARKFVAENYYVIRSDMRSFEVAFELYGRKDDLYGKFFEFLRVAAGFAATHYVDLAHFQKALKLTEDDMQRYEPSPRSQCYSAYFSWLVTHTDPSIIAVCYLLNYPIWAQMCTAAKDAITANPKYRLSEKDTSYFAFYSEPLDDMELMVTEILKRADGDSKLKQSFPYKKIKDCVRVLQTYLVEFWDGIYQGAYTS